MKEININNRNNIYQRFEVLNATSFNVSCAGAILMYEITRQRGLAGG